MVFEGKQGQFVQVILLIVIVFALLLVYVFTSQAFSGINDSFQADQSLTNESKAQLQSSVDAYPSTFDGIVVFVLVGLWILCLIFAYNAGSNPVLGVFAFLIIAALAVVGAILSNAWEDISEDSAMSSFASDFPMSSYILNHYVVVVLVVGFSSFMVGLSRGGFS